MRTREVKHLRCDIFSPQLSTCRDFIVPVSRFGIRGRDCFVAVDLVNLLDMVTQEVGLVQQYPY